MLSEYINLLTDEEKAAFAKGDAYYVSPFKNSQKLNEIGAELEQKYNIPYLYSDFKKENGYQKSISLSKEYHLYRQDYCGCIYSKLEREEIKKIKNNMSA